MIKKIVIKLHPEVEKEVSIVTNHPLPSQKLAALERLKELIKTDKLVRPLSREAVNVSTRLSGEMLSTFISNVAKEEHLKVKCGIASLLGFLNAKSTVGRLIAALKSRHEELRHTALLALKYMQKQRQEELPAAEDAVQERLGDTSERVRKAAEELLEAMKAK